jgi:hypothetical protein
MTYRSGSLLRKLQIREWVARHDRAAGALLLDQFCNEADPAGLVSGAQSGPGVDM